MNVFSELTQSYFEAPDVGLRSQRRQRPRPNFMQIRVSYRTVGFYRFVRRAVVVGTATGAPPWFIRPPRRKHRTVGFYRFVRRAAVVGTATGAPPWFIDARDLAPTSCRYLCTRLYCYAVGYPAYQKTQYTAALCGAKARLSSQSPRPRTQIRPRPNQGVREVCTPGVEIGLKP